MTSELWLTIPALVLPAAVPVYAYATQYLSAPQARKALFPHADRFMRKDVNLTPELREKIEKASGVRVRNTVQQVWRAESQDNTLGWFIVDDVIGKHEFITYALALNVDGSVRGMEILDYRESYGYQIRKPEWRRQFVGKAATARLKLDEDILNISGATLSCRNVTDGVKRLLALYEAALR